MLTGIFAGILALLSFKIAITTIGYRRKFEVAYLGGTERKLEALVSAHSNFTNYTPIYLIMLFIIETQLHLSWIIVAVLGALFTIGRILHFLSLSKDEHGEKPSFKKRKLGMHLTLWPTLITALICIGYGLFIFSKKF